jgi:hypothetical protein
MRSIRREEEVTEGDSIASIDLVWPMDEKTEYYFAIK